MLIGALAALAAAFCWTVASSLWRRLPTSLSAAELNLLKNLLAVAVLLPLVLGRGGFGDPGSLLLLALSGVVGIAAGDSFYFAALRRLGTRRTLTIDAGGPAVAAVGGALWLAELPEAGQWLGLALITAALLLVAWQRPAVGGAGRRELQGVLLALAALLCGSSGALLSRAAVGPGAFAGGSFGLAAVAAPLTGRALGASAGCCALALGAGSHLVGHHGWDRAAASCPATFAWWGGGGADGDRSGDGDSSRPSRRRSSRLAGLAGGPAGVSGRQLSGGLMAGAFTALPSR